MTGYMPLAFFAPKAGYAASPERGAAARELKELVKALHAAGLERSRSVGEKPLDGSPHLDGRDGELPSLRTPLPQGEEPQCVFDLEVDEDVLLLDIDSHSMEHRQPHVAKWRVVGLDQVLPQIEFGPATSEDGRAIGEVVDRADVGPEGQGSVIKEAGAVGFSGGLELVDEAGQEFAVGQGLVGQAALEKGDTGLMLLLVAASADAQPTAGTYVQPTPVSSIDMPVRLSLEPLTEAAEKLLPDQAGHWLGYDHGDGAVLVAFQEFRHC